MKKGKSKSSEDPNAADIVFDSFGADSASQKACMNVMKSMEESSELNSYYQTDPTYSPSTIRELLSIHSVCNEFEKYYRTPYAKDETLATDLDFIENY